MMDMDGNFDLSKVPFDQYSQIIAHYRESGREDVAVKIENGIENFIEAMQRIIEGIQEASLMTDIDERNATLDKAEKDLEAMKFTFYTLDQGMASNGKN